MAMTQWVNVITGERLTSAALHELRTKAHRAYAVNTHIFADEYEALTAFGATPLRELGEQFDRFTTPALVAAIA